MNLIETAKNLLEEQQLPPNTDQAAQIGVLLGTVAAITANYLQNTEEDVTGAKQAMAHMFHRLLTEAPQ